MRHVNPLRNKIRYTLHNLENIDEIIKSLERDIEIIKKMEIDYCISSQLSDMPRSPSLVSSKVESAAIKRVDQIKELEEELLEMITRRRNIHRVLLMNLVNSEKQVYDLRFRCKENGDLSWEQIASFMNMSERQVKHIENKIISKLERIW